MMRASPTYLSFFFIGMLCHSCTNLDSTDMMIHGKIEVSRFMELYDVLKAKESSVNSGFPLAVNFVICLVN